MEATEFIELAELRGLSNRLFERLERMGYDRVGVPKSHCYWMIFVDQAFRIEKAPEIVVGNVLDDLGDVRREASTPDDEHMTPWHAFHHLAGLMLTIANADMQGGLISAPANGG